VGIRINGKRPPWPLKSQLRAPSLCLRPFFISVETRYDGAPCYVPLAHWNLFLRSAGAAFPFSGACSGMWLSCAGAGSLPALAHGTALVPPGGAD